MKPSQSPLNADQILANANSPQSVSADGLTVTARSTKDQLEALDVAAANRTATKRRRGPLFAKIIPGSAADGDRGGTYWSISTVHHFNHPLPKCSDVVTRRCTGSMMQPKTLPRTADIGRGRITIQHWRRTQLRSVVGERSMNRHLA